MYDMYPWNDRPASASAPKGAIKAVQIALDRRDNGGDATAEVAAASTPTASMPTTGPTRQ
jgi:hypothetical protein